MPIIVRNRSHCPRVLITLFDWLNMWEVEEIFDRYMAAMMALAKEVVRKTLDLEFAKVIDKIFIHNPEQRCYLDQSNWEGFYSQFIKIVGSECMELLQQILEFESVTSSGGLLICSESSGLDVFCQEFLEIKCLHE
ncbi:hypothetical protein VNO77_05360 [Canavalia gladiata]|uniref:Uncharacterized protein n=1 Tax=Canavalia gladiata TaxID=3824 RepID=A0AAN9MYW6_CANGL